MSPVSDVGQAIAEAARSINHQRSLEDTLQSIVEAARESVPGFDHVGISTVDSQGRVETQAATDGVVWELDALQYTLGEGPCLDTFDKATVVLAPRIEHDQRWPRYVPKALPSGLMSQMAVRLYLDDSGTVGGLNLYSTSQADLDPTAESVAELFATHAAIALGHARERQDLSEALQTRKLIGQGIGIVMERYDIDEDRAFAFLVRVSSHSNTKLRDVARELVEEKQGRG